MLRILRAASNAGRSTLIARLQEPVVPMRQPRIDVWWRGKHSNGDLMLLLAYLLQINQEWQTAHVAVRSIVDEESQRQEMETSLAALIDETRIPAEPEVIVRTPGADLVATMHERSANSDLVFIGLRDPEPGGDEDYADSLLRLVDGLPTTVLVRSGGEFAGRLI